VIFGVEAAADDRHLGDGVGLDVHASLHINGIVGDDPINHIDHLVVPTAANVQTSRIGSPGLHRTGLVGHHIREAGHRHSIDFLAAKEPGTGGDIALHDGPFGHYHHLFNDIQLGFSKGEIDDRGHVRRDVDILHLQRAISHHGRSHSVSPHRHVDDEILALQVAGRAHGGARDDDVHPREGNAGALVVHPPGDLPGGARQSNPCHCQGETHKQAYGYQTVAMVHIPHSFPSGCGAHFLGKSPSRCWSFSEENSIPQPLA